MLAAKRVMEIEKLYLEVRPSRANKTGDWRLLTPVRSGLISPCREKCPLEGEIPGWLEAVKGDRWSEAWEIMQRQNPFPSITGQVCFHPCTDSCNRQHLDQEIDIPAVERAVGRWRLQNYRPQGKPRPVKGNVAVVGSGPAGLSCAYYLNREGYRVTILERAPVAGGLLAAGIPQYRLPRQILHRELEVLQQEGINFLLNCSVGRDVDAPRLYEAYDQVFWATGASLPRGLALAGAGLEGIWNALDFLRHINSGLKMALHGPVAVVGGGNAAVDAARLAIRLEGIDRVTILYRRGREEMPAHPEEVEAAAAEGVEFLYHVVPRELSGEEGHLTEVALSRSRTDGGKVLIEEELFMKFPCRTLILAVGQEPDLSVFSRLPHPCTIYAGGDLIGGPATVPAAIHAGRVAAGAIAAELEGRPSPPAGSRDHKAVAFAELHLPGWPGITRQKRQADPAAEAERCLGCGTCNACGLCYLYCPDVAVNLDQGHYTYDLDYCKGCGICARECPARALTMEGGW